MKLRYDPPCGAIADDNKTMNDPDGKAAKVFLAEHGFVRAIALRSAPWPDLVDDIVQQVFLEFMRKASKWDLEKEIRPLLATMTRMVAMRHWRTATRGKEETVRQLAEHLRGLAETEEDQPGLETCDLANLHRCIRDLPDRSRTIVELHYFNGLSTREIGEELEMKPDTVCRAMSRVRDALRQCLRKAQIQSMPHV